MTPKRSRTPTVETLQHEREALQLRRMKFTYEEIANRLGYWKTSSGAAAAINRALGRVSQGNVEQYRREEADMIDRMHRAWWTRAIVDRDEKAARVILALAERRSRLLGLDAPVQINTTVTDALDAQIEQLVTELGEVARLEAARDDSHRDKP